MEKNPFIEAEMAKLEERRAAGEKVEMIVARAVPPEGVEYFISRLQDRFEGEGVTLHRHETRPGLLLSDAALVISEEEAARHVDLSAFSRHQDFYYGGESFARLDRLLREEGR